MPKDQIHITLLTSNRRKQNDLGDVRYGSENLGWATSVALYIVVYKLVFVICISKTFGGFL